MSTGHVIRVTGVKINKKTGKVVKSNKHLDVSTRIAREKKPKITYRRGK